MKKYFEIIFNPVGTFQNLIENDDGKHGQRINRIILLTLLLPIVFTAIYDYFIPYDPNSVDQPAAGRALGIILPGVMSILLGYVIYKFLIPFLINSIGQNFSNTVQNINQTRFIVAFSLIPLLFISPIKSIYFIENEYVLISINLLLQLASISSIIILYQGAKLIYGTDIFKTLIIISPYIIILLIAMFLWN